MPKLLLSRLLALSMVAAVAACVPAQKEQPQAPAAPSYPTVGGATMYPNYTLYQNLQNSGDHKTLVSAITAAGAATRLSSQGDFTLFAPTDTAFRTSLPNGTVEALMDPRSRPELTGVVNAHIVEGAKPRSQIMSDIQSGGGHASYRTLGGANLRITLESGRIVVTDPNGRRATVEQADIASANGVFHVTQSVLLPSS
ncbi:fasciclin domain-containing protein [Sphingosinicella humi]|nr:fasciclin domain-containing protein [Sphingosinicella humi]